MSMRASRLARGTAGLAMAKPPARMLVAPMSRMLSMRQSPAVMMHATKRAMMPVPKEEHSAHTISQRLRTLKKIPMELLPLAFVLLVAVFAAIYSLAKKIMTDRTLRLNRSGGLAQKNEH